ncbi:STAS/SEC14 domain-containing protein [bacterium]|nr:STAS/SEC14 domain-containing protein [bacterium]
MKHEIWYDNKEDVLRERIIGTLTEDDIPEFLAKVAELFEGKTRRRAIIDLTQASKQVYSKKARQMLSEGSAKLGYEEKIAFVGADPTIRMMAKVLISGAKFLGKPITAQFFKTDKDAIDWLNRQ